MTRPSIPAIGIDLGTTFSALARIDDHGRPITMVNAEGDLLTPSAVLFDGEDVVVGKEALKAIATEADRVAECSKRDVGHRVYHKLLDGKQYPPEVIEALILNKLRVDAVKQIGPFTKVVVTVPAYFDEVRRKATQDSGYMAGFEVLDIINEPTAAAVSFGFQQGYLDKEGGSPAPRNILVYDLGGGTFDVTIMQIRGTEFNALATDGDVRLGGYDWDQRLVDLAAERFTGLGHADPREDPLSAGKLWRECEDAKRTLSARRKASVACHHRGVSERIEIARQEFEEATQNLLDRTRFTTVQALRAAGLQWNDLERVLLVGGSTRMPMVRDMLRRLSGMEPDDSVAADEAVAHGAALHASLILARQEGLPPMFKIRNVNSHSLGVVGLDPLTGRRRNGILIPRNTRLPVTGKRTFKTQKAGQRSIRVEIVEGESHSADDCTPIGRCSVRNLPPDLPTQYPVEILFHYKPNGRLKVRVTLPETDRRVDTEIVRETGLDKDRLDGWRKYICGLTPAESS
ncbi:MAG: Hsp70 family protein [Planctomycetes bacterium]|nr:Hsp70 family protein [Planctomycetota bacterium]MCG2683596.1 Hsp70 family protein [Planctomycetales bacterium]